MDDSTGNKDYEVGYGKPPEHSRFKPGNRANPKGRPKGSKSLKAIVAEIYDEQVVITVAGRKKRVSKKRLLLERAYHVLGWLLNIPFIEAAELLPKSVVFASCRTCRVTAPQVYTAINAVSAELGQAGIAKLHRNEREDYLYRSIDDVLNRLSPLLAKHKLCVLPRVLERTSTDRIGEGEQLLVSVVLKVAFDLVSTADGSTHTVEAYGEALDPSDKATAKAMSSAYKSAMLQTFCVPVAQIEDADSSSHRLKRKTHEREPLEGWEQWTAGVIDIAASCVTPDALNRLQDRQRPLLKAIGRERPDLYARIGEAFAERAAELAQRPLPKTQAQSEARRAQAAGSETSNRHKERTDRG